MATYFEAVLPSGMCIRLRDLKTRDKLAIEAELTDPTPQQRSVKAQLESLARCILAHTERQPWLYKETGTPISEEAFKSITKALVDAGVDDSRRAAVFEVLLPKKVADTDAMLAAVPPNAWIQDHPMRFKEEGKTVQDVLPFVPDFEAAWSALNRASGFGDDAGRPLVLPVALRTVSQG